MDNTTQEFYQMLLDIIKQENSPEAAAARNMILQRIALSGDVTPSRIEAPQNITQIGGYINLLESYGQTEMRNQMLASVLGIANNAEIPGYISPVLYFEMKLNDRPECPQQAYLPLSYHMRSDFSPAFAVSMNELHKAGAYLPVVSQKPALPALHAAAPSSDEILFLLGRMIMISPVAAFSDPETDPIVVEGKSGVGAVYVRTGNNADKKTLEVFVRKEDSSGYETKEVTGLFAPLAEIMKKSGWIAKESDGDKDDPQKALCWVNFTGLMPETSKLGKELALLYAPQQITASKVREMLNITFNGQGFF
ncbi:MAG: hypothetical protein FWD54_06000 [Endomicrobia bacterium]|nr:hypothetical protein [Endomicrobiia bacterium]